MNTTLNNVTSDPVELAWLAGLLEGEGHFGLERVGEDSKRPIVTVSMTDYDVVYRASRLMGGYKVLEQRPPSAVDKLPRYRVKAVSDTARHIMRSVLPYMGQRRSAKIKEVLAA